MKQQSLKKFDTYLQLGLGLRLGLLSVKLTGLGLRKGYG